MCVCEICRLKSDSFLVDSGHCLSIATNGGHRSSFKISLAITYSVSKQKNNVLMYPHSSTLGHQHISAMMPNCIIYDHLAHRRIDCEEPENWSQSGGS
ncbi:hypothetical protein XELAEV_18017728mg [Xenopus laevis]|uniref:Uncharacterized protein n=1 Tax=Xenopus laevis TaxID=8355 RepID=A0A974DCX6_XENLA|nr:hypothetical protein XELAEV_18017728mg [Xenopus laevis]